MNAFKNNGKAHTQQQRNETKRTKISVSHTNQMLGPLAHSQTYRIPMKGSRMKHTNRVESMNEEKKKTNQLCAQHDRDCFYAQ